MTISRADITAKQVSARNAMDRRECEDPARRERLESDPFAWLKYYCENTYYLPFEKPHNEIIRGVVEAHETGSSFIVAAERGIGKSAILYGLVFMFAASGRERFPVYIPWSGKDKAQGFDFWMDCLCNNSRINADYPEITQPFKESEGVAQRIPNMFWRDTGKRSNAKSAISSGIIVFPDGRGCIGSSTMGGNPRGLNYTAPGGEIIRPTMVLVDDIQDDKTATSQGSDGLVQKAIKKVNGSIGGLKKSGRPFPMLVSGNCIAVGDVMDHFLNQSGWISVCVPCVEKWPTGFDDPKSKCHELWQEWGRLFLDKGDECAFYKKHRDEMSAGIVLTSPIAYAEGARSASMDKRKKISEAVDACHSVMREYFRMGREAFMAERQQQPIDPTEQIGQVKLTPKTVQSRADKKRARFERPEWVSSVVASTDINPSYAFSTVIVGLGEDQSAAVLWYGVHPVSIDYNKLRPQDYENKLRAELTQHGRDLYSSPVRPEYWGIDCGGKQFDAVLNFCASSIETCGLQAFGFSGIGSMNYSQTGPTARPGDLREECHGCTDTKNGRRRRWVAWNTDYWKEIMQKAWACEGFGAGAASLYAGEHQEFSTQICNEYVAAEITRKRDGRKFFNFKKKAGKNNFCDAMAQCYALAAYGGIGTGGQQSKKRNVAAIVGGRRIGGDTPAEKASENEQEQKAWNGADGNRAPANGQKHRAVIGRPGWG